MKNTTEDLLKELKNTTDINSFFSSHQNDFLNLSVSQYLNDLIAIKKTSVSIVSRNSGVGDYLYKVFNGERKPSRDILIATSFGLNLSFDEAQLLLRISKFASLDSKDRRDSIIIFGLTHGKSVFETDDLLFENNFSTLVKS